MSSRKRKSMGGAVQGMDVFFSSPAEAQSEATKIQEKTNEEELERVTLYIRPEQDSFLTELQFKLKRKRIKTNRSELVRAAIDVLSKQNLEGIEKILQETQKR